MNELLALLRSASPTTRVLVNRPRAAERAEYEAAERAYVDQVAGLPEFRAAYRGGRLEHPGISDLDLVVVTADSLAPGRAARFAAAGLDARHRYVHVHDPFPVGRSQFADVTRSTTLKDLAWVAGERLEAGTLDEAAARAHRVVQLGAEIVLSLPREFLRGLLEETLDVRHLLMRLGSLRYPVAIARESLGVSLPRGEAYAEAVRALRAGALAPGGAGAEALVLMLEEAVLVSFELIGAVAASLAGSGWIEADPRNAMPSRHGAWFLDETYPTLFRADWTPAASLRATLDLRAKSGHLVPVLPDALWPHLQAASEGTGPVARHIATRLRPDPAGRAPRAAKRYADAVAAGLRVLDERSRWLERNGFEFGYTHTYGWRPAATFRRRVRRSVRGWALRVAAPRRLRLLRQLPALAEAA